MSRRKMPKKRSFGSDQTYQSILVNLIVNRLLCDGKKKHFIRILKYTVKMARLQISEMEIQMFVTNIHYDVCCIAYHPESLRCLRQLIDQHVIA